ncbi:phosphoglycerate mutase domain protein [Cryptosporidium ryanae]|uniref:phosphoglycerate mutase domain protein n=1 Tax=Cryptosporidium ryanae TaxID=515981 RepID=UPI003519E9B5|nr:phosphoglycerate mutase domain protein [Cryptosporidium ryanae]
MWFFIRHAESSNNATNNNDSVDLKDKYNERRVPDPHLTEIGFKQAKITAEYLASKDNKVWQQQGEDQKGMCLTEPIFGGIYCSPMQRSLDTAFEIQKRVGCPVYVNADLCEVGGLFHGRRNHSNELKAVVRICNGKKRGDILKEYPEFILDKNIKDEGWWGKPQESFKDAVERAHRVSEWLWEISYNNVAQYGVESQRRVNILITHGLFQDILMKKLLQREPLPPCEESLFFPCENCAISQISLVKNARQNKNNQECCTDAKEKSEKERIDPRMCICIKWNSTSHLTEESLRKTARIFPYMDKLQMHD